jgi:serine/threonine protein kinase
VLGTPGDIAPEQARGGPVDGRADLFALGCVFYACLSGEPPFTADDELAVCALPW